MFQVVFVFFFCLLGGALFAVISGIVVADNVVVAIYAYVVTATSLGFSGLAKCVFNSDFVGIIDFK